MARLSFFLVDFIIITMIWWRTMATKTTKVREIDFIVRNEGPIFLLQPLTDAGREWIADHIPEDSQTWGDSTAIEHRYISDIVQGIEGDGLVVAERDGYAVRRRKQIAEEHLR